MADVRNFKPRLSSSRLFSKGTKDLDSGVVDDKVFNRMTSSFEEKKFLTDEVQFEYSAPLIYQLDLLKEDIDDIHAHLSESKFTSKVQKFPVVDVTEEFFVSGLTQLKGNTRIDGHTDIRGAFKINGTEVSDLKKSLDYARALEATGVTSTEFDYLDGVTSNIQTQINNAGGSSFTAAGISGSFTSLSASIATDINNAGGSLTSVSSDIIPDGDNTRDLGSTTKEFKNLFIDGTANLDTANIGTANVTNLDTTTSITTKNFSTTGEFRISKVPTTFSGTGVLDARAQNYFIVANKSNITGIRGTGMPGQIVTILADAAAIAHHAENGVAATEQFQFVLNRDLTFRGPVAHQFIYHKSRYWVRLA
jgi:hypothetical protein